MSRSWFRFLVLLVVFIGFIVFLFAEGYLNLDLTI